MLKKEQLNPNRRVWLKKEDFAWKRSVYQKRKGRIEGEDLPLREWLGSQTFLCSTSRCSTSTCRRCCRFFLFCLRICNFSNSRFVILVFVFDAITTFSFLMLTLCTTTIFPFSFSFVFSLTTSPLPPIEAFDCPGDSDLVGHSCFTWDVLELWPGDALPCPLLFNSRAFAFAAACPSGAPLGGGELNRVVGPFSSCNVSTSASTHWQTCRTFSWLEKWSVPTWMLPVSPSLTQVVMVDLELCNVALDSATLFGFELLSKRIFSSS